MAFLVSRVWDMVIIYALPRFPDKVSWHKSTWMAFLPNLVAVWKEAQEKKRQISTRKSWKHSSQSFKSIQTFDFIALGIHSGPPWHFFLLFKLPVRPGILYQSRSHASSKTYHLNTFVCYEWILTIVVQFCKPQSWKRSFSWLLSGECVISACMMLVDHAGY